MTTIFKHYQLKPDRELVVEDSEVDYYLAHNWKIKEKVRPESESTVKFETPVKKQQGKKGRA